MLKKNVILGLILVVLLTATACSSPADEELILATTTSTENSGLLAEILPDFEATSGYTVKTVAVGTGNALQMGRDGEADVLLVHARPDEDLMVEEGYAPYRADVMYNDFVILGPEGAGTYESLEEALSSIQEDELTFVSRGDNSGTHKKEMSLWASLAVTPEWADYLSAGKGMGDVLLMADEMEGYTMSDRATYLSMQDNLDMTIVYDGDERLFNPYGVLPVSSDLHPEVNAEAAEAFVTWITSEEVQTQIEAFGKASFGQSLFFPSAE